MDGNFKLALRVVELALLDIGYPKGHPHRKSAEEFFAGPELDFYAKILGLSPEYIRRKAGEKTKDHNVRSGDLRDGGGSGREAGESGTEVDEGEGGTA